MQTPLTECTAAGAVIHASHRQACLPVASRLPAFSLEQELGEGEAAAWQLQVHAAALQIVLLEVHMEPPLPAQVREEAGSVDERGRVLTVVCKVRTACGVLLSHSSCVALALAAKPAVCFCIVPKQCLLRVLGAVCRRGVRQPTPGVSPCCPPLAPRRSCSC